MGNVFCLARVARTPAVDESFLAVMMPPMSRIYHTFGPVSDRRARVLILGTMPSARSLAAHQYYTHPRNQFWDIMGALFGAGRERPYRARLATLRRRGVALWDVVAECERPGSLDSSIRREKPNDIPGLLRRCPRIRAIVFNGQPAARLFRRHVHDRVAKIRPHMAYAVLPSTSPAHASRTGAQKLVAWRNALSRSML